MMTASSNDNWVRRFIVSDPRKHRKGFTVYKVTSVVYPKLSPEAATTVIVWKRFSDFKKLHRELQYKHKKLHLPSKFPSFVKAKFFSRFEADVIEDRRKCATMLLEFVGEQPSLFTSVIFVKFFESGYNESDSREFIPLPAVTVHDSSENGNGIESNPVDYQTIKISDDNSTDATRKRNGLERDGPFLKLGGTWQFPQATDSISLSSQSSDECSTLTDTDSAVSGVSSVSSPLQVADLQLFDPLHTSVVCGAALKPSSNNNWLASSPSTPASGLDEKTVPAFSNGFSSFAAEVGDGDHSSYVSVLSKTRSIKHQSGGTIPDVSENPGNQFLNLNLTKDMEIQSIVVSPEPTESSFPHTQVSNMTYVSKADLQIKMAVSHESTGNYDAALAHYKAGISCLLSGVQGENDMNRKWIVREKTSKYLLAAERICREHLTAEYSSPFQAPEDQMSRPIAELRAYKVLGIINKVMLVLNIHEDQCYVIKVLHKSPCPVNTKRQSIIPVNVPYMVPMHQYFETDSSVFLVIHHASGGRLWDHVSSYFHSLPPTPVHVSTRENVYLGKKLIVEENNRQSIIGGSGVQTVECVQDSTLADSGSSHDHSYVELIRDYTTAKCDSAVWNADKELDVRNEDIPVIIPNKSPLGGEVSVLNSVTTHSTVNSKYKVLSTPERMEGGSEFLSDNTDIDFQNNVEIDKSDLDSVPDLLPQSNYSFSWRNLESVDTADLVENAQKLIQSVSETLLRTDVQDKHSTSVKHCSESDVCNIGTNQVETINRDTFCKVTQGDQTEKIESDSTLKSEISKSESVVKSFVRCKSESDSFSSKGKVVLERRRSVSRRCSVTMRPSIERRCSSDDLFEGRTKTASSSLDRGSQWTRMQNAMNLPKPRLPDSTIKQWAAELLVCLDSLHQWGIICRDLRPENILLGDNGHIALTFMCRWAGVDSVVNTDAVEWLYSAPEVSTIFDLTPAADWWSFGALLFELLSGKSLLSCHPGGVQSHTILNIPDYVSEEAQSLLRELLRHNPQERLGSGINGSEELKTHPFFKGIYWEEVLKSSPL